MSLRFLILILSPLLAGCETAAYYSQAVQGQWSLWWQRQPIEELVADETLDPELKQRLQQVLDIREFAYKQLGLPNNNTYRYYSDLHRSAVVWNVFAAEEFSVIPKQWCFPIAGCVSYRGYFSEQAAKDYADKLARQGYDTYVGSVAAYSTLGWFDDPVLNTFIHYDEAHLAGLIFHELAHQQLYIPGDTTFNESFASTVEVAGIERWLAHQQRPELMDVYLHRQRLSRDFIATLLQGRKSLEKLYQQDIHELQKRQRKQHIIDELVTQQYPAFKSRWNGVTHYDKWINHSLNNAKLSTLASYHQWQPALQRILFESEGDLTVFYQRVEQLAQQAKEQREQTLELLSQADH
ncbi:MAG: aminopeptidase [Pseudomonadales bacterium]